MSETLQKKCVGSHMLEDTNCKEENSECVDDDIESRNSECNDIKSEFPITNAEVIKFSDICIQDAADNSSSSTPETDNSETTSTSLECKDVIHLKAVQDVEELSRKIQKLEEKCQRLEQNNLDLEVKLESALQQRELATKEKEATVMRYAVSEKNTLEQKHLREQIEKKHKDALREIEILQHKVSSMSSEKARICQMLDNKCYELKSSQQELERTKSDLTALETKLKWSQHNLKTEMELHKECQTKAELLSSKLQESVEEIQKAKRDAEESIKAFRTSEENKAYVLDQQVKEFQASLILLRHERDDRESQVKNLHNDLERLQTKQKEMLQENNQLSVKVQQLERERLEMQQRLSELRGCADQQRQDSANLSAKIAELEQLRLQLKNEHEQLQASNERIDLLKQRNSELESDMEACRAREAELLLFTQQLTDKNVRLQSEFTTMETKVQQLTCEQTIVKRALKEKETKIEIISQQLAEERAKYQSECETLSNNLVEKSQLCDALKQEVADQKGENVVMKRKLELKLREATRELHQCRKKLEHYESNGSSGSNSSSNTSLSMVEKCNGTVANDDKVQVIQPDGVLDRQTLIEHIAKLQRISARKSEKLDFLEEHINTLVAELQKKSHLLQSYILREQTGALTSNAMDNNKAILAKQSGVMASVYSSRIADNTLTLELSLDINRKLQAVLEDALLKNITLKENVDTLASEIERLNKLLLNKT